MNLSALLTRIDRSEWRFVAVAVLVTVILTTLPYLVASVTSPDGFFYTGLHVLAPGDYPVYASYIDAASRGALVFRDQYTSEPHTAFNLNAFWVPVGWLARVGQLTPLVAFHVARVLAIPLFFAVLYLGAAACFGDRQRRRIAFLLAAFGAGIGGWVLPLVSQFYQSGIPLSAYPMDLWVSEGFSFLSAYQTGHFVLGTTLLLLVLGGTLAAWKTNRYRYSLLAGGSALLLFAFHPFHLLTLAAVLTVWALIEWRGFGRPLPYILRHGAVVVFVALPAVLAQFLLVQFNPIAAGRAAQNILLTPNLPAVLLSYGLLLVGAVWTFKRQGWRSETTALLGAWALVQFLLLFSPVFFQRRLSQGLVIPLAFLTAEAVLSAADRIRQRWGEFGSFVTQNRVIVTFLLLVLFGFSNLVVLGQDAMFLGVVGRQFPHQYYLPTTYQAAWVALRAEPEGSVVLASTTMSNLIPGFAQQTVFQGHDVETLRFDEKYAAMRDFFSDLNTPAEQERWLRETGITHVLWGDWERRLGSFDPATKPYLEPVFEDPAVSLYRVRQE